MTREARTELINAVRAVWQEGRKSIARIGQDFNITSTYVRKVCADIRKEDRNTRKKPKPSSLAIAVRRNRSYKPELLAKLREGYTVGQLANDYGINHETLRRWRKADKRAPEKCFCGKPYDHAGHHARYSPVRDKPPTSTRVRRKQCQPNQ